MVFNIDVTILYLISGVSLFFFTLGIIIGRQDQSVLGIILGIISGLMWISVWSLADNVTVGYTPSQIANTTETGGTTVCSTSAGSTTCTVTAIVKKFAYINSTGAYTSKPDGIPDNYALQGIDSIGTLSQNAYIKVYMIGFGIVLLVVGSLQYNFRDLLNRR